MKFSLKVSQRDPSTSLCFAQDDKRQVKFSSPLLDSLGKSVLTS